MSKFIYTAADVTGCTLTEPNYTQCKDCVYNYNDQPIRCLRYEDRKPSAVIFDGEKCKYRRDEK